MNMAMKNVKHMEENMKIVVVLNRQMLKMI